MKHISKFIVVIACTQILFNSHLYAADHRSDEERAQATSELSEEQKKLNAELLEAAKNDPQRIESLLEQKANVDTIDEKGNTALHEAADRGFTDAVNTLLAKRANVNAKNNSESSALAFAVYIGLIDVVRQLIEARAEIDPVDMQSDTPLKRAAQCDKINCDHRDIARILAFEGADVNRPCGIDDRTPFQSAQRETFYVMKAAHEAHQALNTFERLGENDLTTLTPLPLPLNQIIHEYSDAISDDPALQQLIDARKQRNTNPVIVEASSENESPLPTLVHAVSHVTTTPAPRRSFLQQFAAPFSAFVRRLQRRTPHPAAGNSNVPMLQLGRYGDDDEKDNIELVEAYERAAGNNENIDAPIIRSRPRSAASRSLSRERE
jgi:hypothetical protein